MCGAERDEQQKKKEAVESDSFAANGESNGPNFRKWQVAIWSQRNVSGVGRSLRMSTCTTAPPAFRKRTWSARNGSSVCCASMSRSPAAMARRVFLSRSTKWRRDDEPLEPLSIRPARRPCTICMLRFRADHRVPIPLETLACKPVSAACEPSL